MIGQRTINRVKNICKKSIFDSLNLQEVVDQEEQKTLDIAMGFGGQYEEHRRFQFEFLKNHGLKSSSRILEYGFGPLTLGIPLIECLNKGCYVGVDVRSSVADIAYQQLSKNKLSIKNPRILVSDSFAENELRLEKFDIIWSFSMLFHLSDDLIENIFTAIPKRLDKGGKYWANINVKVDESTWLEFPFNKRTPEFYKKIANSNNLEMSNLGTLKENGFRMDTLEKDNILLEFKVC